MNLHGKNVIGNQLSALGQKQILGYDPHQGKQLEPPFVQATDEEIERAMNLAGEAFSKLRECSADVIASLLRTIGDEITALGDALIDRASTESGLGKDRLTGERARTVNQLRMFADLVEEGSFVDARIDTALPDRKPLPRPDLRRMLTPIGPVVVFGASNFPLAFSVAGGDTASALAAKNPVVVKAHPAHPGTSELAAMAISKAVASLGLPPGTFSLVHGADPAVSLALVRHREAKAVAFTGSECAGRAIFDAAAQRPDPIPAFVEMGSANPVFVLPGSLRQSTDALAQGLFNSINLGVGQFCTCPGLIFGNDDDAFRELREKLQSLFGHAAAGTMLYPGILYAYSDAVARVSRTSGICTCRPTEPGVTERTEAVPVLFDTDAATWANDERLAAEIFGPSAILVRYKDRDEMLRVARQLPGSLTASVHGTVEDLTEHRELIEILETKAGRLIFNGYPTGVEVSSAMHHGGPYPATADVKFTSVGTAAILRFLRPICYQNFPPEWLPIELENQNKRGIWRTLNGQLTRESVNVVKGA
jgi:alpha-ketoglutaric semialdehyde dehydrogenase